MKEDASNKSAEFYAHSKNGCGVERWQTLLEHSENVAELAGDFASSFGSRNVARAIGLLHDAGKARKAFQDYICGRPYDDKSHSGIGAVWAMENCGAHGIPMAYVIAGHHSGLADWNSLKDGDGKRSLKSRLARESKRTVEGGATAFMDSVAKKIDEDGGVEESWRGCGNVSFRTRMLYSCLVDADRIDTERFCSEEKSRKRDGKATLESLGKVFFASIDQMKANAPDTEVNRIRAEVRDACERAAELEPGIFSLTVPTGGGKTLSSTAFAVKHAIKFGKKRIIYVIPYTSIIEQTAEELRKHIGDENVVEHHSNFDEEDTKKKKRLTGEQMTKLQLATENWDAPVIVTTSVQFFESLYSNRANRCRKIHNIADSLVIIDEAQMLPTRLLKPITEAIRLLTEEYGVTCVLCTATQPALPFKYVKEIIPEGLDLYKRLKRTNIELPKDPFDNTIRVRWEDLAKELAEHEQVMCIVNSKKDARELVSHMPEGTVHLSTAMCGAHRKEVIDRIRNDLREGKPIRVVSTQLIEAGVDIDFPVVYRAFAGLPSIVQAAGRCNREGKRETGRVVVFMPPEQSPRGDLLWGENSLKEMLANNPDIDLDEAGVFPQYFEIYYANRNDGALGYQGKRITDEYLRADERDNSHIQFSQAAMAFKMIEDCQTPVIVMHGDSESLREKLIVEGPSKELMRKLQRYVVNVYDNELEKLKEKGYVMELDRMRDASWVCDEEEKTEIYMQTEKSAYSDTFGLTTEVDEKELALSHII